MGKPRESGRQRQGLTRLPRKDAEAWPARCGGDLRSPRKPAGPAFRQPRSSPESPAAAPLKIGQKSGLARGFAKKGILFACRQNVAHIDAKKAPANVDFLGLKTNRTGGFLPFNKHVG